MRLPGRVRGRATVRAWSAGCSTGEEAYSLAMILLDRFPVSSGWGVEVIASGPLVRVSRNRAPRRMAADGHERHPGAVRAFLKEQGKMFVPP